MSAAKTRVLLIVGAFILFVLLFIAPKIAPGPSEDDGHGHAAENTAIPNATLEVYLNLALKNLDPDQKRALDKLRISKNNDSLAVFWDKLKRPDLASYFVEESAKSANTAKDWIKAGNRYYYAVQFSKDKTELPVLYQSAIRCFKKALELEPKNTDARIMLASCYVEGTEKPMDGISMLREIERTDSNNVKLQLTFAFFSTKSGQLDKAIERFNKVLAIDSNYIEAYLHLADAYEQQGNIEKTINCLQQYSARTPDVTAQLEINKYITQLKENK